MMLDVISTFLQDQGIGLKGTNLFYGSMPDTPDDAVCCYEYAGRSPMMTLAGDSVESPGLQIVARSKSYVSARAKIDQIQVALSGLANQTIQGEKYWLILANQSPIPLGPDEQGRHKLALNFEVLRQ
jgi:hypothetical protein